MKRVKEEALVTALPVEVKEWQQQQLVLVPGCRNEQRICQNWYFCFLAHVIIHPTQIINTWDYKVMIYSS